MAVVKKEKTKQCARAKFWCFTWFDFPDNFADVLEKHPSIYKAIAGKEICPTTQKEHIQGWIEFKSKNRPSCLNLPKHIHWECARGSYEDNFDYCTKEGNCYFKNVDKPYTLELILRPWQQKLFTILSGPVDERKIYWIYEPVGGVGKTLFQKYAFLNLNDAVVLAGKGTDMKNGVLQYYEKKKSLPKVVLIDIPRSTDPQFVSYTGLEEVKNMFFFSGKYEGGMVCGAPPHMMIFSNLPPDHSKFSTDRWVVFEIAGDLVPKKLEFGDWVSTPFA